MFSTEGTRSDTQDVIIPSDNFRMLLLNKFCVSRFFEIGFINAATIEDENFLERLVVLSKTKQDITHVTFIDKKEVENFIETVGQGNDDFEFPPPLMQELIEFVEYVPTLNVNDLDIMIEYQAYKMKFKLIQIMYEQYANSVKEMRRQDRLSRELDTLAERKPTTRGRKSNTDVKSTNSRSGKKQEKTEKEDYTETEIIENDLIIDDAAQNQAYFYIFRGYDNIELIRHLLKMFVKLSFIIRVSEMEFDEKKHINNFWREFSNIRNCPFDYLQNIAVFKYQAPPHTDVNTILESSLAKVTDIAKNLIDYKRLHFHYIKNLKIVNTRFTETFRSFPVYEKIMNDHPVETITIPLIINAIIQEVEIKQDKTLKPPSFLEPLPKSTKFKTTCPFSISSITGRIETKKEIPDIPESFRVYEGDHLNLTFRSYENLRMQYVHDNLKILKLLKPISLAQQCNFDDSVEDFETHTHDVVIPSEEEPCFTDEQITHLINLLYLKNRLIHDIQMDDPESNEFTKNVVVFDKSSHLKSMLPQCLTEDSWKNDEIFIDHFPDNNQYESLRPMALHWAEILKPEVLCQYLLESELNYICCDYILCRLTNSLIVRYHNNVNSFGMHTKVWRDYLRTPVGLGDFCKFTLVDDYDWIKNNNAYPQITYADVAKMLEEHTAMYQYGDEANREYRSHLVPQIQYSSSDIRQSTICPCIEENVCKILESCNDDLSGYPEITANLTSIMKDLEEYNNVVDFSEHCKGKTDLDYSFAAYNFGITKFSIIGHTTDFISLDKVRVTVDTSRFCHEEFKMMVKISTESNMMFIHMPQNRFKCHIFLSDDTIVVFSKPVTITRTEEEPVVNEEESQTVLNLDEDIGPRGTIESELSEFILQGLQGSNEFKITAVDFDHYSSMELFPTVGNMVRQSPNEVFKTNIKKDVDLLKRLQTNTKCYKVSNKNSKKTSLIQSKIPERQLTLSSVVKRIIDKPKNLQNEYPKRKCILKRRGASLRSNSTYDCTMTVPNGLILKVLPSEIHSHASVIKQSYEFTTAPEAVSDERYRIFAHDGTVMIGKLNGSMHLLMSSGREIRFLKPTNVKDDETFSGLKKDLTDELIRKVFTRIMALEQDPVASEYYISRRSHLKSKYTSIESCQSFADVSKLPYSTVSMITFEGEKITIKKKKLYKSQYSRHTIDINFQTEERYYKREDGFIAKLDRDGTQYVEFPDGTSIKTIVSVAEEPIYFSKKDQMGWILITSTVFYEHPYYKPVVFDNVNSNIEIRLNDFDYLNVNPQGGFLSMKNSTQINVKADFITFTKDCSHCNSQYKCNLFVEPLYQNRKLKEEPGFFLVAEDSYNKTFKADFKGNCKINPEYIHTAQNERKCHHSVQFDHQRIYLIKNDLEGMILWNDKAVSAAMRDSEEEKNIHHFNDERNSLVFLTISRNLFTKFSDRFFGKTLKEIDFGNFKPPNKNSLIYQTTRNIYSMFELDQIDGLMNCLKKFFQEETMKELALSLSALKFHLSSSKFSLHSLSQLYPEEEEASAVNAISLHDKLKQINKRITSAKKIMKMPLPNYFHSNLCTYIDVEKPFPQLRTQPRVSSPEIEQDN